MASARRRSSLAAVGVVVVVLVSREVLMEVRKVKLRGEEEEEVRV